MDELSDSSDESSTPRRYQTAAGRLNSIIREARRTVSSTRESSFVSELGNRFPFAAAATQTSSTLSLEEERQRKEN